MEIRLKIPKNKTEYMKKTVFPFFIKVNIFLLTWGLLIVGFQLMRTDPNLTIEMEGWKVLMGLGAAPIYIGRMERMIIMLKEKRG